MPKAALTINGTEVWAEPGSNLLEAALQNGFTIPHLCYDPRIKPFGSCRLCFVDIGGPRGPVPACGTTVAEGMNVVTDNDELRALRQAALELLLSEHCGDCIAPCRLACPAGIDIQGYIAFLDRGDYKQAADLIKEKMPLPSVCGRVCPRFCEAECRRNLVDEPVNICDLKRFAGDFDLEAVNAYAPAVKADTGKTVAVVGGGPAGLTAAYYLAREGHQVTLYDSGPLLGGMLRYGIPEYRLPKALLDREINLIAGLCREVRLGEVLGRDFTLEELREKYDAVFLGLGCQSAQGMGLEREEMPGVLRGIDFLRSVAEGNPPALGRRVAVVGGGNTAMDAARTALRLGAEEVFVIYRRSRNEMPASPVEIAEAEEEGIIFHFLTNPVSLQGGECLAGIECLRMALGEPDASGRRRPIAVQGSEFALELDNVIMAIGQALDQENACACGLDLSGKNLASCPDTGATPREGVFAAGDAVTGPATVVEAVGAARKAARAMDRYLKGLAIAPEPEEFNCSMGKLSELDPAGFADREKIKRLPVPHLAAAERRQDFREYNYGLAEADARRETARCLSCGCQDAFGCTLRRLAAEFGITTDRLGVERKRHPLREEHPDIRHDPNKCILCAGCVRICHEVQGANALCLVNRGYETVVKPFLELPLNETTCESCGQCVSACPTGALTAKGIFRKPGPWKDDRVVRTTCLQCGIGCLLDVHVAGDKISRVTSPLRQEVNDGSLCSKGSFGYGFAHDPARLVKPLVRSGGELQEAGWEEALAAATAGLQKAAAASGPDSLAVLLGLALSNEESYLALKLAREVLGTPHLAGYGPAFFGAPPVSRPLSYAAVAEADFILAVDLDLPEDYPIIAHKVRQALDRGAALAVMGETGTRLDRSAAMVVPFNWGEFKKVLRGLLACAVSPGQQASLAEDELQAALAALPEALRVNPSVMVDLAAALRAAHNPAVVVDGDMLAPEEMALLEEVIRLAGRGEILPLYSQGNTRGQLDLLSRGGTGGQIDHYDIAQAASRGEIRGILMVGDGLLAEDMASIPGLFTVAVATSLPEGLQADVILPAATCFETRGTVVNCEGRLQELRPAFAPPGGRENWEILKDLAAALGHPFPCASPAEILAEIKEILTLP